MVYESRYLPSSSMTTFFNKPAFENYGSKNTGDKQFLENNYMKTFNTNPNR